MKQFIKSLLVKAKIYEYIKYSSVFYVYSSLFKPWDKKNYKREVQFYRSFLSNCNLIFDIGANDGHKTEVFLTLSERIVCCEPDDKNFKTLQVRFRNKKNVYLQKLAVAASAGIKKMYIHHKGSAFNTLNHKFKKITEADDLEKWNEKIKYDHVIPVESTTLDELIIKYGKPDFIKIDVEGYELEVLKGLSQPISDISLECLFPEFKTEFFEILGRLQQLDSRAEYNIAINEILILDKFLPVQQLKDYLFSFAENHFELIVKMKKKL
ncbi:MAG: FkbM family methyltransferase [Chitinophagaceae bacterium]